MSRTAGSLVDSQSLLSSTVLLEETLIFSPALHLRVALTPQGVCLKIRSQNSLSKFAKIEPKRNQFDLSISIFP
jgi:hypothetical protein